MSDTPAPTAAPASEAPDESELPGSTFAVLDPPDEYVNAEYMRRVRSLRWIIPLICGVATFAAGLLVVYAITRRD